MDHQLIYVHLGLVPRDPLELGLRGKDRQVSNTGSGASAEASAYPPDWAIVLYLVEELAGVRDEFFLGQWRGTEMSP